MNKTLQKFAMMAAAMAMMAGEKVYADDRHYTPTKNTKRKTYQETLADKGLQEFVVNGETIIAHNEREAQKRYKSRHK